MSKNKKKSFQMSDRGIKKKKLSYTQMKGGHLKRRKYKKKSKKRRNLKNIGI